MDTYKLKFSFLTLEWNTFNSALIFKMVKLEKKDIMLFEKDLKQDGHSLTQSVGCGLIPRLLFKSNGIKLSTV